jgi:hypothetical protein
MKERPMWPGIEISLWLAIIKELKPSDHQGTEAHKELNIVNNH